MNKILFALHGFDRKKSTYFNSIKPYFEENGYTFVDFDYFDETNLNPDWLYWVANAEIKLKEYVQEGNEIILIGFDLGGVIATYLSTIYPISHVILLAPSYQWMDYSSLKNLVRKAATILEDEERFHQFTSEKDMGETYYAQAVELSKNMKKFIQRVSVPTLVLMGTKDEFVSKENVSYAYNRINNERKLALYVEGASHDFLLDEKYLPFIEKTILLFIQDII